MIANLVNFFLIQSENSLQDVNKILHKSRTLDIKKNIISVLTTFKLKIMIQTTEPTI